MRRRKRTAGRMLLLGTVAAMLIAAGAEAQESPYVAMSEREIKALSTEQVEGYLEGRGMGFALAGELNGYPGPKHVLEMGQQLGLSITQRKEMQEIYDEMHERAVDLGRQIVDRERQLDHWFVSDQIDEQRLVEHTREIGRLNGLLRGVHLRAHLEARRVLTPHQRSMYAKLRGYNGEHRGHH